MRRTLSAICSSRILALTGITLSLAALAYGCSDDEKPAASTDAGTIEAAAIDRKTPDPVKPADAGVTCEPNRPDNFATVWKGPMPARQNKCSPAQIATYADCAYSHAGYDQAKCTAFNKDAANAECITCARPPATSAKAGAMVDVGPATNVNYAGCVALFTDDSASGCGAKLQAAEQCTLASCEPNCPAKAGDQAGYEAFSKCLEDSWSLECLDLASATRCADPYRDGGDVAGICFPQTNDFGEIVRTYLDIFCGAPADGGTDAAPDAPSDAADASG